MKSHVFPIIDWRKVASPHKLVRKRVIIRLGNGTVIDSMTAPAQPTSKAVDPDQYELHLATRDPHLDKFVIMFINTRNGQKRLNPAIRSLTFLDKPIPITTTARTK